MREVSNTEKQSTLPAETSWMHARAQLPVKRSLQTQHQLTAHVANEKENNMRKHQIMQAVPDSVRSEIGGAAVVGNVCRVCKIENTDVVCFM